MPLPIIVSIALLLLVSASISFTPPTIRKRLDAKIVAGLVGLGAIYIAAYSLGAQAGRDTALRDNRADARAAARSAADTATGSTSP